MALFLLILYRAARREETHHVEAALLHLIVRRQNSDQLYTFLKNCTSSNIVKCFMIAYLET